MAKGADRMSLVAKRTAIASALATVADVTGTASRPAVTNTGSAWPLLGPIERDQQSGQFMITWRVFVVVPWDEIKASDWIDTHLDQLWEALEPEGYIDSFEPALIGTDAGDVRALQITMRSE